MRSKRSPRSPRPIRSLRLASRMAWKNVRRRPGQAALLLLTLTIATATVGVAQWLTGSADGPWDRVWAKTNGFHVQVTYYAEPGKPHSREDLDQARRDVLSLARAPGVVAAGGPFLSLDGTLNVAGEDEEVTAEIRSPENSPVDQPLITDGRWLGSGQGIVLEDGLARTLHIGAGDAVSIQGHRFPVRGVAMTVSQGRFPLTVPALVWVTPDTAMIMRRLGMSIDGFDMELRLADPASASAFVAAHRSIAVNPGTATVDLETWEERRAASHSDIDTLAAALFGAGLIIALLTIATAAVIVTGRMAAQSRQVGALKAVGMTPLQAVSVLLLEYTGLALVASVIGLTVGRLLAPALARTSLTVLGDPGAPSISWTHIAIVASVALAVVILATVRPALRGIRQSTLSALESGARPPRRTGGLARLAATAGAPLVVVLGLRSAWRRPGRLLTNAAGLTLGVAMIVVGFGLRSSLSVLAVQRMQPGQALTTAGVNELYHQVRLIVLGTAALLLALGTINAFIVATFAARDSARNHAALRAVGTTPRQTVATLIVSQLGACVAAIVIGIPLGVGLWSAIAGGDLPRVGVPATSLVLVAVLAPLAFAAIVSIPARRLARRSVAPLLTYD